MKNASKFLSLILRHKPEEGNITLDEQGWVAISDVLRALRSRFGSFNREQLDELVATNDKKRFAYDDHGLRIRANQGHSVEVDLKLDPKTPPPFLYHGTKQQFLDSILRDGLTPRSRQHVHLSRDIATAEIVAGRRAGRSVLLTIDTSKVPHQFFESDNGVWLTDGVPPPAIDTSYPWED